MNRENFQKLAGILPGQLDKDVEKYSEQTKTLLQKYVSWLRALHLWFHGAHHATKGTGFAGDHGVLYDRIYTEAQDEVDGAAEKIVGITNDKNLACPNDIIRQASVLMENYYSPVELPSREIAAEGLRMEKDYINFIESLFNYLEKQNLLTLGLNDQLAASANTHETYVYLLQQRIREDFS